MLQGGGCMADYNVMIVDDRPEQAEVVMNLVRKTDVKASFAVETCASIVDLEAALARGYLPEIVFMDVSLSDQDEAEDGIEASRRLFAGRPGVQLIYVSGHSEFCTRAYRTEHIYFLLKPLSRADFEDALEKAVCNLETRATRPFGVKVGGRIMRVVPSDVDYVESDRRKVRIFMGDQVIEAYESLAGILQKLPRSFVQCHKSFLVNIEKVTEVRSDAVVLSSGVVVPVSQKRSRATREAFAAYLLERM